MKKILLIKLSALGDVIFNIPLANTLKSNGYEVHWLTTEKGIDLIKDNPCSDKTYLLPLYSLRKKFHIKYIFEIIKLIKDIRKEKYDIAFDCQRRIKSMPFMLLSGAKRRIISNYSREGARFGANEVMPREKKTYHMVKLNQLYAQYIGLNTDEVKFTLPEQSEETKEKVKKLLSGINPNLPTVIISPATTWEPKHWAVQNWKKVIDTLKSECNLVFTGMEKDRSLISLLNGDSFINLAGQTNIHDMMELYKHADLVITPDSGSAHIAWASSKPAIIEIFCCTAPHLFGCFGNDKKYFTLKSKAKCSPCNKRHCNNSENINICTTTPTADEVIEIALKILSKASF